MNARRTLRLEELKSEAGADRWTRHEPPAAGAPAAPVIGTPSGVKLDESLLLLVAVDGQRVEQGQRGTRVAPGHHELGFTAGLNGRVVALIEVELAAGQDCHARLVTAGEHGEVRWRCRAQAGPR